MDTTTRPTVRDLIAELAATEDVLREHGRGAGSTDRAVRHRQREIVVELRRRRHTRHPNHTTDVEADGATALVADVEALGTAASLARAVVEFNSGPVPVADELNAAVG